MFYVSLTHIFENILPNGSFPPRAPEFFEWDRPRPSYFKETESLSLLHHDITLPLSNDGCTDHPDNNPCRDEKITGPVVYYRQRKLYTEWKQICTALRLVNKQLYFSVTPLFLK